MTSQPLPDFRQAGPEHAGMIRDLVRAAYARWVPVINREPMPMVAHYDKAVREHRIDLFYLGEHLAGLIEMIPRVDHLWIENVAVSPEMQGQGIGRQLLARAEAIAHEAGHRELRLVTNSAFEANVRLYEKTGYVIVETKPFMGGTSVYMNKTLA